jgi:hypothetical protein
MNKRIEKKVQKRDELAHQQELSRTAWGRITLSYEHLQSAFAEFLETLSTELKGVRQSAQEGLRTRAQSLDEELTPQIAKVPVVGPNLARGLHELASATR